MTEKVKTVIESFFLLPDFKSRGHPTHDSCGYEKFKLKVRFGNIAPKNQFEPHILYTENKTLYVDE